MNSIINTRRAEVRSKRRLWIASSVTAEIVVAGGGVYAGSLLQAPQPVETRADDMFSGNSQVSDLLGTWHPGRFHLVADIEIPDGRRFAVWRASNAEGGQCQVTGDDWDGGEKTRSLGLGCGGKGRRSA